VQKLGSGPGVRHRFVANKVLDVLDPQS
jgi:hypothetical protein